MLGFEGLWNFSSPTIEEVEGDRWWCGGVAGVPPRPWVVGERRARPKGAACRQMRRRRDGGQTTTWRRTQENEEGCHAAGHSREIR
jgi:hypothetical protein